MTHTLLETHDTYPRNVFPCQEPVANVGANVGANIRSNQLCRVDSEGRGDCQAFAGVPVSRFESDLGSDNTTSAVLQLDGSETIRLRRERCTTQPLSALVNNHRVFIKSERY